MNQGRTHRLSSVVWNWNGMTNAPIRMSETARLAMNRLVGDRILLTEPIIHIIIILPKTAKIADRQQQPNVTITNQTVGRSLTIYDLRQRHILFLNLQSIIFHKTAVLMSSRNSTRIKSLFIYRLLTSVQKIIFRSVLLNTIRQI